MPHVHEINDIDELAGDRLLWNHLLPQTRQATFFQSLDWLEVYWRHFGHDQRLRAVVVSAAEEPVGILPLVVRTETTTFGPVRTLTYPLHDWGSFYGPIGPNPTATLVVGLEHVRRTPRDWDLIDLRWIDAGLDAGRTPRAFAAAGFRPHEQVWAQTSFIEMTGTWQDYWKGRSRQWRLNVGRLERRLAEHGEVTYVRHRPDAAAHGDGEPRWDLYDACVDLSRRSWQGASHSGTTLCHPNVETYLRQTHAAAASCGAVDMNLLVVDGKPAAFIYNYHYRGRVYGLRMGYDPDMARFGPGTVLTKKMIQDSFVRGDCLYDMGIGSCAYKRRWLTSTPMSTRYTHFPAAPRTQLLHAKRWLQDRLRGREQIALSRSA